MFQPYTSIYPNGTLGNKGIVHILFALGFVALLTLVGLAIDATSLYRAQVAYQGALDAGAVSGARCLLGGSTTSTCELTARGLVAANLSLQGFDPVSIQQAVAPTNLLASFQSSPQTINLTGTLPHPTYVLHMVPGIPQVNLAAAVASAENVNVHISIVVDRSESMKDLLLVPMPACPSCVTRLDAAVFSAKEFIQQLWPTDQVAILSYGVDGNPLTYGHWWQHSKIVQAMSLVHTYRQLPADPLDSITAANADATHIASGLQRGLNQLINAPNRTTVREIVILLTDGVPYGYSSSALVTTNPSCPLTTSNAPNPPSLLTDLEKYRYLDALWVSDAARAQGITVYTIGFGTEDQNTSDEWQQFNRTSWGGDIKTRLMDRLANDQPHLMNPTPLPSPPPANPTYYYDFMKAALNPITQTNPCMKSGSEISADTRGQYFFAGDGTALLNAFLDIAVKIRTSIIH